MARRSLVLGGVAAAAVLALGAFAAGQLFLRDDAPPAVTLADAVSTVRAADTAATTTPAPTSTSTATAAASPAAATPAAVVQIDPATPGHWRLLADGASFVGYRVREELARVGVTEAVGRTTAVSGSLAFDGNAITAVQVTADLTRLRSDESRRDRALGEQSLETATFPSAEFRLTGPIPIAAVPVEGEVLTATALGELTLHGVTREVTLDLEGQLADGLLIVVGSHEIVFADYAIEQPRALAVLSVEDHGVIELQLVFARE